MSKIIVGIDSGITGGIALLKDGELVGAVAMPTTKTRKGTEVDAQTLYCSLGLLCSMESGISKVIIEEPGGAKSYKAAVSMAASFHCIRAVVEVMGLPLVRITPAQWQKKMLNCKAGDTKPVAAQLAKSLWPSYSFLATERSKVPHAGLVDAAIICEYGRRHL